MSPTAYFFCCARKSRQKDALGDAPYCALTRANLFNALFGRKTVIFPIAYTSGKCTTRRRGQTAIISVLLISGILGRLWSCPAPCRGRRICPPCSFFTHVCRGRCPHRPLQTYKQYWNRKLSGWSQFCARIGRSGRGAAKHSRASARNISRIQRLFLHTFSDKPEKVCRRRHGCGIAAKRAVPVKPEKRTGLPSGPPSPIIAGAFQNTAAGPRSAPRGRADRAGRTRPQRRSCCRRAGGWGSRRRRPRSPAD